MLPRQSVIEDHEPVELLRRTITALDLPLLLRRGWDSELMVFQPAEDDDIFGWTPCQRAGCDRGGSYVRGGQHGLCDPCGHAFNMAKARTPGLTLEDYKLVPYIGSGVGRRKGRRDHLCLVCCKPGHSRLAKRNGLCVSCAKVAQARGQTAQEHVDGSGIWPPAQPRVSLADCSVEGCNDYAEVLKTSLCRACAQRFNKARRERGVTLADFRAAGVWGARYNGKTVDLSGLDELPRAQFLIGLQRLIRLERTASLTALDTIAHSLQESECQDIRHLSVGRNTGGVRQITTWFQEAAQDASTTLDEMLLGDLWRSSMLFPYDTARLRTTHDFGQIPVPWLRDLAKLFCASKLTEFGHNQLGRKITHIRLFATFLAAAGRGATPGDIDRHDIDRYVITARAQKKHADQEFTTLRALLRFARRKGYTEPGQLAAGLRPEVDLLEEDTRGARPMPEEEEAGKAIPEYVLSQLLAPDALATFSLAAMFEIAADVGRRPREVCGLRANCLEYLEPSEPGGPRRPVLRYWRKKRPSKWHVIPIHEDTAERVRAQQQVVLARFPGRALKDLALFPRRSQNPVGNKSVGSPAFSSLMRKWVTSLPTLVDIDGNPFDRSLIYPYALRHSYAQRHADSGKVSLDELQELMDHRSPETTQVYYRVRNERLFAAIEAGSRMTINRDGEPVSTANFPTADRLAQSIGQIPVPLGYCVEPHNVKTLGSSCPFSHQCLGCTHYRTDPSYLPELYAYLERLLDASERLRSTLPELAEWARQKALPNAAEISAVRRLIRSNEILKDELAEPDRRKLEELFRVLRGSRSQVDDTLPIEIVAAGRQSKPTFVPPRVTPLTPSEEAA